MVRGNKILLGNGREERFVTVRMPTQHDGVGTALRSTYPASTADIPDDLQALLRRLDRI